MNDRAHNARRTVGRVDGPRRQGAVAKIDGGACGVVTLRRRASRRGRRAVRAAAHALRVDFRDGTVRP